MTTLRQAAQQALEALENIDKAMPFPVGKQAITALREALAQPAQEPTCPKCKAAVLYECVACSNNNYPPRPEQEPCIGKDPRCPCQDGDACHYKDCGDTKALPVPVPVAQPEQEPVEVDQDTMELAESVGLIGPASRTHGLHAAIQRFHDLICVNATIKAAKMAADAIRESTLPSAQPEQEPSQWREMVVVTLVREGINKHRARELADHFAAERNNG